MSLRSRATTCGAAAAGLGALMRAWGVRRLRLALLTGPTAQLLELVAPQLEALSVAPDRQPSWSRVPEWEAAEAAAAAEEEGEGPGWLHGCCPVGRLPQLPPGLTSFEAGCMVEVPAAALASAPRLLHACLDFTCSVGGDLLEAAGRGLPPRLQSLALSFSWKLGHSAPFGRVLDLGALLQVGIPALHVAACPVR